ncbi:MAG TPA: CopG family antitoxin [Syntrophobacteraceae bacterium]|nr:CopG family antitoxin [Syntrophobacteraceae bacterium]
MRKQNSSSLSRARSYKEIGEFWDSHDLADYWDQTLEAEFEVEIESEVTYYALGKALSEQVRSLARKEGISADTLLNLWVQEKLRQEINQAPRDPEA